MSNFLESLLGSFGILLAGFITIPLAAHLSGEHISMHGGALMSAYFFIGRFVWLYTLRVWFERLWK